MRKEDGISEEKILEKERLRKVLGIVKRGKPGSPLFQKAYSLDAGGDSEWVGTIEGSRKRSGDFSTLNADSFGVLGLVRRNLWGLPFAGFLVFLGTALYLTFINAALKERQNRPVPLSKPANAAAAESDANIRFGDFEPITKSIPEGYWLSSVEQTGKGWEMVLLTPVWDGEALSKALADLGEVSMGEPESFEEEGTTFYKVSVSVRFL